MLILVGSTRIFGVSIPNEVHEVLVAVEFVVIKQEEVLTEYKNTKKIFSGDDIPSSLFSKVLEDCAIAGWKIEGTFGTRQGPPIEHKRYMLLKNDGP